MREGKVCTAAPNIQANFGTIGEMDRYGTINFDSGAIVSYIHDSMITHSDYVVAGRRTQEFYGAGGDRLKLKPHVIDIKVNIGNKGVYEFKNVLVATSDSPSSTMLVGQSDLERLGIDISFANRTVTFGQGPLKGVPLPMEQNWICSVNPIKLAVSNENSQNTHQTHQFVSRDEPSAVGKLGTDDLKVKDCCVNKSKRQKSADTFNTVPLNLDAAKLNKRSKGRTKKRRMAELELLLKENPQWKSPLEKPPQQKADKDDVSLALVEQSIDFPKRQLLLKKTPSMDPGRRERRWTSLDPMRKVFSAMDRIYPLYWDSDDGEKRRKMSEMPEFKARTVLLTNTMQPASIVPLDLKMMLDLQLSKVAEPRMLIIKTHEIPNDMEMDSDDEEFSMPLDGEKSPSAEEKFLKNCDKRTKSGRLTRKLIRLQTGIDDAKRKLNLEWTAAERTRFHKKKKRVKLKNEIPLLISFLTRFIIGEVV